MQACNGTVDVQSDGPGKGSCFTITMYIEEAVDIHRQIMLDNGEVLSVNNLTRQSTRKLANVPESERPIRLIDPSKT